MPPQDRPAAFFIGDSTALDFLNSVAAPRGTRYDWLENGTDLLDWLARSGLASSRALSTLQAGSSPQALDRAAADIRAFREAFRSFIQEVSATPAALQGHPMIGRLNQLLQAGAQQLQIVAQPEPGADRPYALVSQHRLAGPDDILPRIAAACAELVAEADFRYVRNCDGPGCTLYFRDLSKNHKRRWCTMEVCGNRAKAAAYRQR